jgi:hypothetical protein
VTGPGVEGAAALSSHVNLGNCLNTVRPPSLHCLLNVLKYGEANWRPAESGTEAERWMSRSADDSPPHVRPVGRDRGLAHYAVIPSVGAKA